jgi:NAD(P)-dependent dehydrogenase (short-subunit alcohol dehydrogenase family)
VTRTPYSLPSAGDRLLARTVPNHFSTGKDSVVNLDELIEQYDFSSRVVIVTGGAGILGGEMACALVGCNASVAIVDRDPAPFERYMPKLNLTKGRSIIVEGDVLKRDSMEQAAEKILAEWGRIDCLVNAAGGNNPKATTATEMAFFDLPEDALRFVADLNLLGTIIPSQVFGKLMARQKEGVILNVSSMNAFRPLTRIPAYSAAKAAVSNFTQWLAVHMAQEYSPRIRVNAVAPGFFLTEQNRFLLTDRETGTLTARGEKILAHTPMNRFGTPADLLGAVLWLLSPMSQFVTGIVLPVDGGFSAYSGV